MIIVAEWFSNIRIFGIQQTMFTNMSQTQKTIVNSRFKSQNPQRS